MNQTIDHLPQTRRDILYTLKRKGPCNAADLAAHLELSTEGIRQHLVGLERENWIERRIFKSKCSTGGRPTFRYALTQSGENLFPKLYDELAIEVVDAIVGEFGEAGLNQVLDHMVDERVKAWEPFLAGLSFDEKIKALKNLYKDSDPFMEVTQDSQRTTFTEYNCPVLNVATKHPVMCHMTISILTRLLGVKVAREEAFQHGDGRCVFRIMRDQPADDKSIAHHVGHGYCIHHR